MLLRVEEGQGQAQSVLAGIFSGGGCGHILRVSGDEEEGGRDTVEL